MSKKFIKRYFPRLQRIRDEPRLQVFGKRLRDPNLWHFNRRSVAGACAAGLFMAFMPLPSQMILAAGIAILLRINLPISAAMTWVTNPFTAAPLTYFNYKVGALLLDVPPQPFHFEPSLEWVTSGMVAIWKPLLLGSFITGLVSAAVGYIAVRIFWRMSVLASLRARRLRHANMLKLKREPRADRGG
jgi:Uncharacterized protein conserved in bacteria